MARRDLRATTRSGGAPAQPSARTLSDAECVSFLRWALPRLGMRWPGFRKVRGQVCKRVGRRMRELGLSGVAEYRAYLDAHAGEWQVLDGLMSITISRFYRDRGFFDALAGHVLPELAREAPGPELRVWSAGCASGEEPYSVALVWELVLAGRFPDVRLRVLATDLDEVMLARAERACYPGSSLAELPADWRSRAFAERDGLHCLRAKYRSPVTLLRHDIRTAPPDGPFDLVLCRNVAFTYFDEQLQRAVAERLAAALREGGAIAVGTHERLPETAGIAPWIGVRGIYRKARAGG